MHQIQRTHVVPKSATPARVKQRAMRGFTIVELMVVLAIFAIMGALATPSLRRFSANQLVKNTANEVMLSMQEARSYAVSRNRPVTISANGGDWTAGWQIFIDTNANATLDAGDELLSTRTAMDERINVQGLAGCVLKNSFTYHSDGFLRNPVGVGGPPNGGVGITTAITPKQRCIVVNRVGRPRIADYGT